MKTFLQLKLFSICIALILIAGCKAKKAYKTAVEQHTITQYERYVNNYPKHKNVSDANVQLEVLYENRDWENTLNSKETLTLEKFIRDYPNSIHIIEAKKLRPQWEESEAWESALYRNTIKGYNNFMDYYPNSSFENRAKEKIEVLKENEFWIDAKYSNSSYAYKEYLKLYPKGKYKSAANKAIYKMDVLQPAWDRAKQLNTVSSYNEFLAQYGYSDYAESARYNLKTLDQNAWTKALSSNNIQGFKKYEIDFPEGIHVNEVEKKIIDLEVDAIFAGDYGKLPPMSRTSTSYSSKTTVKVKNDTKFTLTVRYSGNESKKIILSPGASSTTILPNGAYRVAASVDANNVSNYAGKESLSGGEYSASFYIETVRY